MFRNLMVVLAAGALAGFVVASSSCMNQKTRDVSCGQGGGAMDKGTEDPAEGEGMPAEGEKAPAGMGTKGPGTFTADFRESGDFFTLMEKPVLGKSPHGTVQIWYSKNAENAIRNGKFPVPEGTTVIKPSDKDSDGRIDLIAVMIKMPDGFDPDHGDWRYEVRTPEGGLMDQPEPGAVPMCIECHKTADKTDYLASTELR